MSRTVSERDWKHFKDLHAVTLGRLCERVLAEAKAEVEKPDKSAHARYLSLFKQLNKRNKDVVRAFDDVKRSTAALQIGIIYQLGLFKDSEVLDFSPETREYLESLVKPEVAS